MTNDSDRVSRVSRDSTGDCRKNVRSRAVYLWSNNSQKQREQSVLSLRLFETAMDLNIGIDAGEQIVVEFCEAVVDISNYRQPRKAVKIVAMSK